jgi:hypothetical protein
MAIGKANKVLAVQIVFNMQYSFESLALPVPSVATEATVYRAYRCLESFNANSTNEYRSALEVFEILGSPQAITNLIY